MDAKTRGLNMEDTRLTDPRKIGLLMSLTALAIGLGRPHRTADKLGKHDPADQKPRSHYSKPSSGSDSITSETGSEPTHSTQCQPMAQDNSGTPESTRLSNPRSGNSAESGSCILAFPLDVGLRVGGPFFVDLDQHGADEAQEGILAWD